MKKGKFELGRSWNKKELYLLAFEESIVSATLTKDDLKDLRDLITEELGEDEVTCEKCEAVIPKGFYHVCHVSQPLTEGEGEKPKDPLGTKWLVPPKKSIGSITVTEWSSDTREVTQRVFKPQQEGEGECVEHGKTCKMNTKYCQQESKEEECFVCEYPESEHEHEDHPFRRKEELSKNWSTAGCSHEGGYRKNCGPCNSKENGVGQRIKEPSKKTIEDCSLGNCPFYPYSNSSWGMSPDGWARAKENHDRKHGGRAT